MVYETGTMKLDVLGELGRTAANRVLVCSDIQQPGNPRYLLWHIFQHEKAKQMLSQLYGQEDNCCIQCFTDGADTFFVFPYRESRMLRHFFSAKSAGTEEKERVYLGLVLSCIGSRLPCSLLYLVLRQDQINISLSGEIYFTLNLDLSQWNQERQETACVQACVEKLLCCMEQGGSRWEKDLCRLLKKKADRSAYGSFTELYRDITLMEKEKTGRPRRPRAVSKENRKRLFLLLRWGCSILAGIAVIIFISQLFWGEVPLFRLLEPSFEKIGTESLLQ